MRSTLLFLYFSVFILHSASALPDGVWRSRGYFSLEGKLHRDRCTHLLSFSSRDSQMVWLEMRDLVNWETGDMKVELYRDTVDFNNSSGSSNELQFYLSSKLYSLQISGENLWLIGNSYKILFEKVNVRSDSLLTREFLLEALIGKPFGYKLVDDYQVHGLKFITDSTMLVQHNFDEPFEGIWTLFDLGGYFFLYAQVSHPFLITGIAENEVLGMELDHLYEPRAAVLKPTSIFFKIRD